MRTLRVNEIELVNLKGATVGWINKGGEPSLSLSSAAGSERGAGTFELALTGSSLPELRMGVGNWYTSLSPGALLVSSEDGMTSVGAGTFAITDYGSVAGQKLKGIRIPPADAAKGQWQEYMNKRTEAADEASAVKISTSMGGGGGITVRNTFGKAVVSIQANKRNEGAVYVYDVNGKFADVLAPNRPH